MHLSQTVIKRVLNFLQKTASWAFQTSKKKCVDYNLKNLKLLAKQNKNLSMSTTLLNT